MLNDWFFLWCDEVIIIKFNLTFISEVDAL